MEECNCRRNPQMTPVNVKVINIMSVIIDDNVPLLVVIARALVLSPRVTLCPSSVAALAIVALEPSSSLALILIPTF